MHQPTAGPVEQVSTETLAVSAALKKMSHESPDVRDLAACRPWLGSRLLMDAGVLSHLLTIVGANAAHSRVCYQHKVAGSLTQTPD